MRVGMMSMEPQTRKVENGVVDIKNHAYLSAW